MGAGAAALAAACSAGLLVLGVGRLVRARIAVPGMRAATGRPGPLARHPAGARLATRLGRAGIPLTADAFVAAVAGVATLAAVVSWSVMRMPAAAIVAAAAVAGGATATVRSADRRHRERVERQLPGIAQQLAAGLGAGLSLRQALTRAARDAPEPAREELAQVVRELELGGRIEAALEGAVARMPVHDLRIMVTAILVQRRSGGNLARALAALSDRLEERGRLARELRGATAQARMTAWLVAALPVGAGVMAEIASPGTLARVLGRPPGLALLVVSSGLYAIGVVLVRRIGRVEP